MKSLTASTTRVEDRPTWRRMGLQRSTTRPHEWEPGSWQLAIVHDKEVRFRLTGVRTRTGKCVCVDLTEAEFASSVKVAEKVFLATRDIDPRDPNSICWQEQWRGSFYTDEYGVRRFAEGLKAKLIDAACHSKDTGGVFDGQRHHEGRSS
jgi:hypothetical protein